jgi:hypothetical protein
MPWLWVNQTAVRGDSDVPTPSFALVVHRAAIPGKPGASAIIELLHVLCRVVLASTYAFQPMFASAAMQSIFAKPTPSRLSLYLMKHNESLYNAD